MSKNSSVQDDDLSRLSPAELAAINGDDGVDTDDLDDIIGDDAGDQDDDELDADDAEDAEDAQDDGAKATNEPVAQFQPQVVSQPVENFVNKIAALDTQKADLRKQLNDGDIDLEQYEALKDKVTDEATDLRLQQRDYENDVKRKTSEGTQRWEWEIDQFFSRDANKIYGDNKLLNAALDTAVKELANDPVNANQIGSWFLEEADRQVRALMGGNPAPATRRDDKGRKPDLSGIPKTLSNIPAAESTDTGGEEFAYLDKLGGSELERALATIARDPAKESRYLRS